VAPPIFVGGYLKSINGPCHVSGIFLPLRVNSLPLATIYEVKIPLRKWKISLLQRNPAQMTWHISTIYWYHTIFLQKSKQTGKTLSVVPPSGKTLKYQQNGTTSAQTIEIWVRDNREWIFIQFNYSNDAWLWDPSWILAQTWRERGSCGRNYY
jgi:hypothetical protein